MSLHFRFSNKIFVVVVVVVCIAVGCMRVG